MAGSNLLKRKEMKYTGLYDERLVDRNVPIVNAAAICKGQRLWLSVATSLLTVIITAETTVWSPDQMSEKDMVSRASRMARLLIETVIK